MITREDCFKVGEVAKTHNLQGEVVITTDSDLLEKYADEPVFLLLDGAPVPFFIADEGLTVRNHTSYIVKFDYVDTLAQAGRLVGCEVLFEKELLEGQEPEESGYDIWIANYARSITYDWPYPVRMWQYTSSGSVSGISTNVDMNIMYTGSEYSGKFVLPDGQKGKCNSSKCSHKSNNYFG